MYSPDNQREYALESGAHNFSVQGLSDALTALESGNSGSTPIRGLCLTVGGNNG